MDFTREPIIETVISPRDGYKLLIRNSKEASQEEYSINALEIVSFGSALFFRCLEKKPKAFLLPIADYDVIEVKEARMVLKNISTDKPIKIAEGNKSSKENNKTNKDDSKSSDSENKKTAKKRHSRKRRSSKGAPEKETAEKEVSASEGTATEVSANEGTEQEAPEPKVKKTRERKAPRKTKEEAKASKADKPHVNPPVVSVIFPPPPKIIGKSIPNVEAEKAPEKEIFPEAVKKEQDETQVASSKDLPPIGEIKEKKETKKESKKAESAKKES